MDEILIALVEDEAEARNRLIQALSENSVIRLIFTAQSASEIIKFMQSATGMRAPPHVLLVDLGLPDGSGIEVIKAASKIWPQTDCMVVTIFGDEANMIHAFEAGAKGYLLKDGSEASLSQHVQQLHAGGSPMSPIIARQLLSRMNRAPQAEDKPAHETMPPALGSKIAQKFTENLLTQREYEILQYISRGYTYPEVARYLSISLTTVLTHVRNIYSKLSVHNKTEAVFEARQMGILD